MHQLFDRFLDGFWIDFEGQLGAILAPQIDQKLPQTSPRLPQDAPKPPKTTPRQRFWDDFKASLEDFWKICWKNLPSNLPPRTYFPKKVII